MRFCIVDASGVCVNVIEAPADWPEGIASETGNIGDSWNGQAFVPPPPAPTPAPTPEQINAPILAQLRELDFRRIRPLAEGEPERVAEYNAQIIALRAQLV